MKKVDRNNGVVVVGVNRVPKTKLGSAHTVFSHINTNWTLLHFKKNES